MTVNPFTSAMIRPGARDYHFHQRDDSAARMPVDESLSNQSDALRCDRKVDRILDRLKRDRRGCIVGPHGTGKSTLVCCLRNRCEHFFERVVQINTTSHSDESRFSLGKIRSRVDLASFHSAMDSFDELANSNGLLIVDGAEQLGLILHLRLLKGCQRNRISLLLTSHRAMPFTPTLFQTSMTPDLIRSLTGAMIVGTTSEIRELVHCELEKRDLEQITNLRDLWFDLYDVVQRTLRPSLYLAGQGVADRSRLVETTP